MSTPFILPAPRIESFGYHSRILFHWRASRMRVTPLGGETATFTRTSDATVNDSFGVSRTVGYDQTAWTSVSDVPYLWLSRAAGARAADSLSWPFLARPQVMTIYVRFIEFGSLPLASARVLTLGSAALGTPYLYVYSTGSFYRAEYHNGSVAVTATLAVAPATNDRVELRVVLNVNGSVTIAQTINEGAEGTPVASGAPGSGPAIATAWSATTLWLNGEAAASAGIGLYRTLKIAAGVRSLTDCRSRMF